MFQGHVNFLLEMIRISSKLQLKANKISCVRFCCIYGSYLFHVMKNIGSNILIITFL